MQNISITAESSLGQYQCFFPCSYSIRDSTVLSFGVEAQLILGCDLAVSLLRGIWQLGCTCSSAFYRNKLLPLQRDLRVTQRRWASPGRAILCCWKCHVLIFIAPVTNCHTLSPLKHTLVISQFISQKSDTDQAKIKVLAGLCSFLEAQRENLFLALLDFLQNSVSQVVGLKYLFLNGCQLRLALSFQRLLTFLGSWPSSSILRISKGRLNP